MAWPRPSARPCCFGARADPLLPATCYDATARPARRFLRKDLHRDPSFCQPPLLSRHRLQQRPLSPSPNPLSRISLPSNRPRPESTVTPTTITPTPFPTVPPAPLLPSRPSARPTLPAPLPRAPTLPKRLSPSTFSSMPASSSHIVEPTRRYLSQLSTAKTSSRRMRSSRPKCSRWVLAVLDLASGTRTDASFAGPSSLSAIQPPISRTCARR